MAKLRYCSPFLSLKYRKTIQKTMRKLILLCLMLVADIAIIQAQNEGINFLQIPLREAFVKAKEENKQIFIDCYIKTCVPCKYLMKNEFPKKECGDFFNDRYICLSMDMDEGDGPAVRKNYEVGIYPTFLVINPNGTLFCKEEGAKCLSLKISFVEQMKRALDKATWNKQYHDGRRDTTFVKEYIAYLRSLGDNSLPTVVDNYLCSIPDAEWVKPENWNMIMSDVNDPEMTTFLRILAHRPSFENALGKAVVEKKIMTVYREDFRMHKMLDIDFGKRINELDALDKAGYKQARNLADCMLIRWIINEKDTSRVDEIVNILVRMKANADRTDRMAILKELIRFERVANADQRQKAAEALSALRKGMKESDIAEIDRAIRRISPTR